MGPYKLTFKSIKSQWNERFSYTSHKCSAVLTCGQWLPFWTVQMKDNISITVSSAGQRCSEQQRLAGRWPLLGHFAGGPVKTNTSLQPCIGASLPCSVFCLCPGWCGSELPIVLHIVGDVTNEVMEAVACHDMWHISDKTPRGAAAHPSRGCFLVIMGLAQQGPRWQVPQRSTWHVWRRVQNILLQVRIGTIPELLIWFSYKSKWRPCDSFLPLVCSQIWQWTPAFLILAF